MNKNFITGAVSDYLAGKITRSELSFLVRNRRAATPFRYENYCIYEDLIVDGIEQKLSAIPEESYSDEELKHIVDVLKGKMPVRCRFVYRIPAQLIDSSLERLIQIAERLLCDLKQGITDKCKYIQLSQEDFDYCQTMYGVLSDDKQDTVVKGVALHLLSIINRHIGAWDSVITYFPSSETISDEVLTKDLVKSVQALCGKKPVYVYLGGFIDCPCATIVL